MVLGELIMCMKGSLAMRRQIKLMLLSHDLVLCFATPVFSPATLLHEINSSAYVNKGCSEHIKCFWSCWCHMHWTQSSTRSDWCPQSMRKEQYETHTAIPNTLLHDNSNCRCVTTVVEFLMVLRCNRCIASFSGHMGMSPSVTWSGPISYSLITKLLLISVECTQQAYTISVDMFGWHFLCEGISLPHYPNKLCTSPSLQLLKQRVAAMFV